MDDTRNKIRLVFVAALLLLQLAGAAHVYSHDLGSTQGNACAVCSVADSQHALGAASSGLHVPHLPQTTPATANAEPLPAAATLTVRQRGPPTTP
jgi:hypothetical protein